MTKTRLSIALVMTALALSACGQNGTETKAPGEVVFSRGNGAEPKSLDPAYIQGTWEDDIGGDLLVGLTTQDAKGEPIPGAAEKWETSPDGLTWTFHLRDHVWLDGTPVTAQDFVFAWRRMVDPKTASGYAYFLDLIKNAEPISAGKMPTTALGVSAPDDKTVVVTLEHPASYITQYMMHSTLWPVPRHLLEAKSDAWSKPANYVSNGPFLLKEWVPNDHVTLVKNPKFYDAANVKIDRVIFYPTSDYEAALKRFRAGELDMQSRLPLAQIDWLRANMPNALHLEPILVVDYYSINFNHKPLGDIRVREALSLALDRETLTNKITKLGEPGAYSIVPPGTANFPGGNALPFKDTPQGERLKQAQALMVAAGYGPNNHLKTTMLIRSASADAKRVPAAVQQMWHLAYIDADIVQLDAAIFYDKVQQHDFDIAEAGWSADFNDASNFLDLLRTGNSNNYGGYSNPAYDALLDKANVETDGEKRGQLMKDAEALALKDEPWLPIFFWVSHALTQPYVKGWETNVMEKNRTRWISIQR